MNRLSFCIVGFQGSGKSTAADYLRRKFPGSITISSGALWDEILGRDMTHYERTIVQKEIVREKGEGYFVDYFIDKIRCLSEDDPQARFIIEGVRSREVLSALKEYFGSAAAFIWMSADKKVRMERSHFRGDENDFNDREKRDEDQFHLASLEPMCEFKILNGSSDPSDLFAKLDEVISKKG